MFDAARAAIHDVNRARLHGIEQHPALDFHVGVRFGCGFGRRDERIEARMRPFFSKSLDQLSHRGRSSKTIE
jgi:hypothetical protein